MLCTPRDWQQIKQGEALVLAGTPEGNAKLAEAKRYGACADEIERLRKLYFAVGDMMDVLGAHGTICARDDRVQVVMDALHEIDGGERWTPNGGSEPTSRPYREGRLD